MTRQRSASLWSPRTTSRRGAADAALPTRAKVPVLGAKPDGFFPPLLENTKLGDEDSAPYCTAFHASITAEIDPLMSEGKAYADRLKSEGVKVSYQNFTAVTHEFFGMAAVVPKAKQAEEKASADLKKAFAAGH